MNINLSIALIRINTKKENYWGKVIFEVCNSHHQGDFQKAEPMTGQFPNPLALDILKKHCQFHKLKTLSQYLSDLHFSIPMRNSIHFYLLAICTSFELQNHAFFRNMKVNSFL